MLLAVCTQLLPEYTGLTRLHIQNKAMMMLIPEFPWSCSSLIITLLYFSSPTLPPSPSWEGCLTGAQGEVCTHWGQLLPHSSVQHLLCQLPLLLGKKAALHRHCVLGFPVCQMVPCPLQATPNCWSFSALHRGKERLPLTNSVPCLSPGPWARTTSHKQTRLSDFCLSPHHLSNAPHEVMSGTARETYHLLQYF